jgi:hypothetical protein
MKLLDRTAGDEVDQLLRDFYKSEMPEPFPALKLPAVRPAAAVRWNMLRQRVALAASIGLLVLGGWLMAGSTGEFTPPSGVGGDVGSAGKSFIPGTVKPGLDKGKSQAVPNCCEGCK